jgi:cytochrome d ubiquinol oxidase subunit II
VAFANIVAGVPINEDGDFTGTLLTLLNPYGLLGGATVAALCLFHGANFLSLKTEDDVRERAHLAASILGPAATALGAAFLLWTQLDSGSGWTWIPLVVAALALVASMAADRAGREGYAFVASGVAIAAAIVVLFGSLYPDVMPSTTDPAYSLTVDNASSTPYTLKVMTWVAVGLTPVILIYQGWSYWVFRQRIGRRHIPAAAGGH